MEKTLTAEREQFKKEKQELHETYDSQQKVISHVFIFLSIHTSHSLIILFTHPSIQISIYSSLCPFIQSFIQC